MFWSIIAANKRRTIILIAVMGLLLILAGYVIGMAFVDVYRPWAGIAGLIVALCIWCVMLMVSLYGADRMFLGITRAQEVRREHYPQLYNVVEEMVIAGSLPGMPRIFVVEDPAPNAFAMGRSPQKSCVCVTAGLLALCNRDELQGVIAHEISHIMNRDILFMTVAATMLGSILLVSDAFVHSLRYSGGPRFTSRARRTGGARSGAALLLVSLLLAIVGPVIARILYFAISRKREYLADATGARLTRYPEGLASALEKMQKNPLPLQAAPSAIAPFYIVNPYRMHLGGSPFATHPPLAERIRILRMMSHGAGYVDYTKAYITVTGSRRTLIPLKDMGEGADVPVRESCAPEQAETVLPTESRRRAGDIIRAMNNFAFITCACGLRLKLPPEFREDRITCPRCGRSHLVPEVNEKTISAVLTGAAVLTAPFSKPVCTGSSTAGQRKEATVQVADVVPGRWQTIQCSTCDHAYEISPRFRGKKLKCSGCGATIRIRMIPEDQTAPLPD